MRRVVFDTNVWVSAVAFPGAVRRLLGLAWEGRFQVVVSAPILDETARVLGGRKFRFPPERLALVDREMRDLALLVHPVERVRAVPEDPDDDRVLECALEGGAGWIVTGDAHLLGLGQFRGIRIVAPQAFMAGLSGPGPEVGPDGDPGAVQEESASYRIKEPRKRSHRLNDPLSAGSGTSSGWTRKRLKRGVMPET